MAKEIEYTIKPNGEVTIETFNTQGTECTSMIQEALAMVGGTVADEKKKKEYFDKSPKVYNNAGR